MNKASSNTWIQSSWHRTVTWVLFCGGLVLLAVLLWRMGPGTILTQLAAVGWKLPLVVLPYVFVAVFDALGWWYAFPQKPYPYGYFDLFRRRLAAKAINDVTPAFSMAGELAKVHVLQLRGIDGATAVASVVAAKTTLTLSELWFLFIALLLVPLKVPAAGVLFPEVWIGLLVAGLGIAGVILWQRNGLFCPFIDPLLDRRQFFGRERLIVLLSGRRHERLSGTAGGLDDQAVGALSRHDRGAALTSLDDLSIFLQQELAL